MKRVMVFGTFDILHPGHIDFLKQARRLGDFLIVSIARENYIRKIKGHKALHSELERKHMLEAIKYVDKAVFGSRNDYISHIKQQKPDIIALGYDQSAFTEKLKEKLAKKGLKVKVVRLKAHKPGLYKTSKIFKSL